MIKIEIKNKYLYIKDGDKHIAYFEHFEGKKEKVSVIDLSQEDKEGEKFIKENNCVIQDADVYWFSSRPLRYKVMFISEKYGAFQQSLKLLPPQSPSEMKK